MYKEYYGLSTEPFRLTPDPGFVYAHQSYNKAQACMHHALQQAEGILVITGRSGTGKTTLVENFVFSLKSAKVPCATLVSTQLETEDVLRMVSYAFGLDVKDKDKATLLHELEKFFIKHSRALLIIDEAQNLSAAALEELRMLTNMHTGKRTLLQIFLLGQEQLHERLHTPDMEQLHQRLLASCILEPLDLQETQDYVLHRLNCVGWRGNPAIATDAFILIHRFSQGLPRYISKLCARLFLHGAVEKRNQLDMDDVVEVIKEIQQEQLQPLSPVSVSRAGAALPPMPDLLRMKNQPVEKRIALTTEEQAFIESNPVQAKPAPISRPATPIDSHPARPVNQPTAAVSRTTARSAPQSATASSDVHVTAAATNGASSSPGFMHRAKVAATASAALAARTSARASSKARARVRALAKSGARLWRTFKDTVVSPYLNWQIRIWRGFEHWRLSGYAATTLLVVIVAYLVGGHSAPEQDAPNQSVALASAGQRPAAETIAPTGPETGAAASLLTKDDAPGARQISLPEPLAREPEEDVDTGQTELSQSLYYPAEQLNQDNLADYFMMTSSSPESGSSYPAKNSGLTAGLDLAVQPGAELATTLISTQPVEAYQEPAATVEPAAEQDLIAVLDVVIVEEHASRITPPTTATDNPVTASEQALRQTRDNNIEDLLRLGKQAIAEDRLRFPEERSAWLYYRQVMEIEPDNKAAMAGLQRITARYAELAIGAIEKQRYEKAELFIKRGLGVVPADSELLGLQLQVEARQAELLAIQERELYLTVQTAKTTSPSPAVKREPESKGLFGKLKSIFTGKKPQTSSD